MGQGGSGEQCGPRALVCSAIDVKETDLISIHKNVKCNNQYISTQCLILLSIKKTVHHLTNRFVCSIHFEYCILFSLVCRTHRKLYSFWIKQKMLMYSSTFPYKPRQFKSSPKYLLFAHLRMRYAFSQWMYLMVFASTLLDYTEPTRNM